MSIDLSNVTTVEEIRSKLKGLSMNQRKDVLNDFIDQVNIEIEMAISNGNNQLAIWKMSQAVLLEDELMRIERYILEEGILL